MTDAPDFGRLMQGVLPYLAIDGCEAAVAFYEKAFGAILHGQLVKAPNGKVMNATLEINGGIMMLMDAVPGAETPEIQPACNQGLTLQLITRDGDFWWNRAVAAGCTVTQPLKLEFWGDRYGRLQDPFGMAWAINEPGAGK